MTQRRGARVELKGIPPAAFPCRPVGPITAKLVDNKQARRRRDSIADQHIASSCRSLVTAT